MISNRIRRWFRSISSERFADAIVLQLQQKLHRKRHFVTKNLHQLLHFGHFLIARLERIVEADLTRCCEKLNFFEDNHTDSSQLQKFP